MKLHIFSITIVAIMCFGLQQISAQNIGDYRTVTTGNYNALSTWQRFNGSTWVTPTTAQGWPGQFTGLTAYFLPIC